MSNIQSGEIRKFKMHPDLLFSVIKAQAGTQEKALLEAVMNSVDAGATECNLTIDENGYCIVDNGRGFASRKEVDEFFETFGTPHKEGDAKYGRFRMGRGQLFAFSSTVWKTNTFEMHVDIKKDGLDYTFKEQCPSTEGCIIEGTWYEKLPTQSIYQVSTEFEKLIKYIHIPVYLNGKRLSVDIDSQKWDYQDDDFHIKVNRNSTALSVYNMGALVSHYPAYKFGVSGTVVTKNALKINLARNDVLVSECPLWKKITRKMNEIMGIEIQKRNTLNDSERIAIINKILAREIYMGSIYTKGLLEDISGKKISFKTLLKTSTLAFSSGIRNQKKIEEKINDSGKAMVLSHDVLSQFQCENGEEFVEKIKQIFKDDYDTLEQKIESFKSCREWDSERIHIHQLQLRVSFDITLKNIEELTVGIKDTSEFIPEKELSKTLKIFLKTMESTLNLAIARIVYLTCIYDESQFKEQHYNDHFNKIRKFSRQLHIGRSDTYDAWTDGKSYIVINEKFASSDPVTIINLLIHEYCHNENSNESHDHGVEFYSNFHEVVIRNGHEIHNYSYNYQRAYNRILLREGLIPKKYLDENLKTFEDNQSLMQQKTEKSLKEEATISEKIKVKNTKKTNKNKNKDVIEIDLS